jgi:hypothetical protein
MERAAVARIHKNPIKFNLWNSPSTARAEIGANDCCVRAINISSRIFFALLIDVSKVD